MTGTEYYVDQDLLCRRDPDGSVKSIIHRSELRNDAALWPILVGELTGAGDSEGSRIARLERMQQAVSILVDLQQVSGTQAGTGRHARLAGADLMFRTLTGMTTTQQNQLMAAELSARQVKAANGG